LRSPSRTGEQQHQRGDSSQRDERDPSHWRNPTFATGRNPAASTKAVVSKSHL
jgi:hypothetical protein